MKEPRLPVKQLVILSICRFAEPIALTSVFPYMPELMEFFGVPENDIAHWAGIASSTFSICQACTGLLWGAASDRYGRKPMVLFGFFNTMWTMLLWGFSVNLPMALMARALQGLTSGNIGILRTIVAELCPWKELQPRAFSVMPLVYTTGATIGPVLGGGLANPLRVDPHQPRGDRLLEKFPFLLPNLVAASLFMVGIVIGWLFLEETLESKRHERDLGLKIGAKISRTARKVCGLRDATKDPENENEPLLGRQKADNNPAEPFVPTRREVIKTEKPKIRDVLNYQTTLNLVVYFSMSLFIIAYDQLLPVFMHHPVQSRDDPNINLPLKFAGGFGMSSRRIGAMFTAFAVFAFLCQFFLFPPVVRRLGVLQSLRISLFIFPFVFFVTPFMSLIPNPIVREISMNILMMVRGLGGTFAWPSSTILLTNSASSLQILGTVNGIATSVAAIGRAAGPAICGGLFTLGVKQGYVIVPFWTLSAISLIGIVPTFWLVEGKGFGNDNEEEDVDDEEGATTGEEHIVDVETMRPQAICHDNDTIQSELGFGSFGEPMPNLLSHTSTRSSAAVASDEESDGVNEHRYAGQRRASQSMSSGRHHSGSRTRSTSSARRRTSIPIGMGQGFGRYSSNLGSTGVGSWGSSWGGT